MDVWGTKALPCGFVLGSIDGPVCSPGLRRVSALRGAGGCHHRNRISLMHTPHQCHNVKAKVDKSFL